MMIACNQNGLANRLKALLSVMHLSPNDYGIYWPKGDTVLQCRWHDLFENDIETTTRVGSRIYDSWRFAIDRNQYTKETNQELDKLFKGKIDFQYEKTPVELQKIYSKLREKLIPVKYVRDEVKKYINFSNSISVHVRSWGDSLPNKKPHWVEGMQGFKIENFINEMKKYTDSCKFFVACDNDRYLKILINAIGEDRIFYRPKRQGKPGGKEQIQDALIDMLLLSMNRQLIGSYRSTFTDLAWHCHSYIFICHDLYDPKTIILGGK